MSSYATELAEKWDNRTDIKSFCGSSYSRIYETIEFFNNLHYGQYIPTQAARHGEYLHRFDHWLENVDDDVDKRTLFELAPRIMFYGREEFAKLNQAAFDGPITRWVIDSLGLGLDDPQLGTRLPLELACNTWYCPVTDSMPISDFHHANNVGGIDFRPDFRSLAKFADPKRVLDYMRGNKDAKGHNSPLKRIVLLEDFVGGGTQIEAAIQFAGALDPAVDVLFVPLLVCPRGAAKAAKVVAASGENASYEPVLHLRDESFINSAGNFQSSSLEATVRDLAKSTYKDVCGDKEAAPRPYSPFGCWETGATVVMYSNTPANTLPVIQHESNTWKPLFRRSARIR